MTPAELNPADDFIVPNARRRVWLTVVAVGLILGVHVAGRIGAYCSPLSSDDSYIFASFGCRMAQGDVLYRDMSDIKPPGLFMLYALVYLVAPPLRISVAPVETVFLLLGYAAIYGACVELYSRRVALAVTVLASVTINYFAVTGVAIVGFGVAENFMVFPAAAAAWMYLRALRMGRDGSLIIAGLFLGMDTCFKQTALPLVVALVIHWTVHALRGHRDTRRWIMGLVRVFVGGCIGWSPAILLLTVQGTLGEAARLLTSDAGAMLHRGCAWPDEWRDVLPLWIVIAWGAWAVLSGIESHWRRRGDWAALPAAGFSPRGTARQTPRGTACQTPRGTACQTPRGTACQTPRGTACQTPRGTACQTPRGTACQTPRGTACQTPRGTACQTPRGLKPAARGRSFEFRVSTFGFHVMFVVLWIAAEVLLLWRLPLRSPHYYVVACVPFMLLSGAFVSTFDHRVSHLAPGLRRVAWSVAVILSGVFLRPAVDEIVPRAIAAYRSYDWPAARGRFEEALEWGPIHFGGGEESG